MNILFGIDLRTVNPGNPYVLQLTAAMTEALHKPVACGARSLHWDGHWDVVHFQWPETLFDWRRPSREELAALRTRLRVLRRRAAIVTTVHNHDPLAKLGEAGRKLHQIVYSHSDAFVHLGKASVEAFAERHGEHAWCRRAVHRVIEHGDYGYYRTIASDDAAVSVARPSAETRLLTVFGTIRSEDEERLAREAFQLARPASTNLVFAGRVQLVTESSADALKRWTATTEPNIVRFHTVLPDPQIAPLMEASRFLFLPRAGRLNSGVIPLAYTFGVPVIGPDEGVIGEVLRASGGIVYAPGDTGAAARTIASAFALSEADYAALRRQASAYAAANMSWRAIAAQHLALYSELNRPDRRVLRYLRARRHP